MNQRGVGLALILGLGACLHSARAQRNDSVPCGACLGGPALGLRALAITTRTDTGRQKAVELSDGYAVRLKIHLIGSYLELPLFVSEYFLGEKLLSDERNYISTRGSSVKGAHSAVALGLGALFTSNTITGVWNLIEGRHSPGGFRRWLHSVAMLVADGGFLLTANAAGQARQTDEGADRHRNLAIGSMSLAAASTIMMWLWKD